MSGFREIPRRAIGTGIVLGAAYGIISRAAVQVHGLNEIMGVMTIGFLFVVPVVVGFLTVYPIENPSVWYAVFGPWVPSLIIVVIAALLGWEGAICIVMGAPVLLVFASMGGLIGMSSSRRAKRVALPLLVLLPFASSSFERHHGRPTRVTTTETSIIIKAQVGKVWPFVVDVDSIRPEEEPRALFTTMGFPHPISARLDRPGIGGKRTARFTGGLVFTEHVSRWEEDRIIGFTIRPNTDSIPTTTLDPHVTIGGPYFDVLEGTYELFPVGRHTKLVLRSMHRETTPFNIYSGWWADIVMRSIQRHVLEVIRQRAELSIRPMKPV